MRAVLDTNIIYRSGGRRLLGTEVELIAKSNHRLGIKIFVPELVLEEILHNYADDYQDLCKAVTKLSHHIVRESKKPKMPESNEAVDDYSKALDKRVSELGIKRIKHDNITHRQILDRIFNRRKPFPTSGKHRPDSSKGYRDSLIWEMVCRNVADKKDTTIFITDNWQDFAESKTAQNKLHPQLREDLKNLGLEEDAVVLCSSLEDFNRQYVKPELVSLNDIKKKIEDNDLPYFILPSFFKEQFGDIFNQAQDWIRDMDQELSDSLGEDVSDVYLASMYDPDEFQVAEVRKITDTEFLVSAEIEVEVEIEFFLDKSVAWTLDDDSTISVSDYNWNEWVAEAGTDICIMLELDFILDDAKKEVTDFNIVAITLSQRV